MTTFTVIEGGAGCDTTYRCPVCVSNGLPGQRFYLETVGSGLGVHNGVLRFSDNPDDITAVYCAKCKDDGVQGWRGKPGLIAEGPDFEIHSTFSSD